MFLKFWKSLDIYGHRIGVQYRGETVYKTYLGAFFSIISFVIIVINAANISWDFISKEAQEEKVQTVSERLIETLPLKIQEQKFDIAILDLL